MWPWTVWPGRDVDRQEKGAEGPAAFGLGGRNHPWAVAGPVVARTVCCQQSHPAHVVVDAGIFWRTSAHKRSPVFRRWARRRIPLTMKGLRVARAAWQAIGGPFAEAEECRSAERAGKPRTWFAEKLPSGPAAGDGRAGRAHGQEKALRAGRPAGHAGHGPRRRWRARLSGSGVGQEPLRPLVRGREAPRLDVPVSTGSVPLQSG